MRVAVEELEGVESVEVSLNQGRASVRLADDNRVTVGTLRRLIRERGFSPREAALELRARVETRGDRLMAVVPGSGETYHLMAPGGVMERLRAAAGALVVLHASLAADVDGVTPRVLQLSAFPP